MNFFKWKYFLITSFVCLSPIILGILIWDKLPDVMPIHFDINGNPDNFASKEFTIVGLPVLMVLFQGIICLVSDLNVKKHGINKKIEAVTKWILPVITIVLQFATFGMVLGYSVDMRIIAAVIVGVEFLFLGNYLPKMDYIKNYKLEPEKAKKINRFRGYEMVVMGILFLFCIFLPPMATVVCLMLLIPCTLIGVIYGIYVAKKK